MLSKRADFLVQTLLGVVIIGIFYIGVERLLLSKYQAIADSQVYAKAYAQCQSNLKNVMASKVK